MTIIEAINRTDALVRNTFNQEDKVQWLSGLDSDIKTQVLDHFEDGKDISFSEYNADRDLNRELLVKAPHDVMYLRFLEAQIHYYNGEIDRYNNTLAAFNAAYGSFCDYYLRTHKPISSGQFQF